MMLKTGSCGECIYYFQDVIDGEEVEKCTSEEGCKYTAWSDII